MIRDLRKEEITTLVEMVQRGVIMSEEEIRGKMEGAKQAFVYEDEGAVKGVATLEVGRPNGDVLCVIGIYVDEPYRRQGIGSRLWTAVQEVYRPLDPWRVFAMARQDGQYANEFFVKRGLAHWFHEYKMRYDGEMFPEPALAVREYWEEDSELYMTHWSEAFTELRTVLDARPHRLSDGPPERLDAEHQTRLEERENIFMFFDEGRFVGSAFAENEYEVNDVFVCVQEHRRGYGKQILQYTVNRMIERGIHPVYLGVADANQAARRLYEGLGFAYAQTMGFVKIDR